MVAARGTEIKARKIVRVVGRRERCWDQCRACDQALGALVKMAHHKVGWLQRRETHADGDVEAFGNDIDAAIGALEMHHDRRVFGHEPDDQRSELEIKECDGATHPHDATWLGAELRDHLLGGLGLDQHRDAPLVKFASNLGYREMPRRPVKQSHTEPILKLKDAAAQL